MKEIIITRGMVALVDDEDYERLNKYRWFAVTPARVFYAIRKGENYKDKMVYMHHEIIGKSPGFVTDHIDGNGLNNQKINLRHVTVRENAQNRHRPKTSKYPGVTWDKKAQKWRPHINVDGKIIHMGSFDDEEEAYSIYVKACEYPQNAQNLRQPHKKSSQYPGVTWNKRERKWRSQIWIGRQTYLGSFDKEEEAATAYLVANKVLCDVPCF